MKSAARIFPLLLESRKSQASNTRMAGALHEFLPASNLSNNLRRERFFSRCTTMAQRVQFPVQWKEARNFADAAI
jgi:hypothetical protein